MNSVVVDSSAIVKWLVTEKFSQEARLILAEYHAMKLRLLAPDLIYPEIGNVIWKNYTFQGMDKADARLALDVFQKLKFIVTPTESLSCGKHMIS